MHPILGPKDVGIGRKVRLRSKKTLPNLVDKIAHWDNQRSDIILCRGISAVIIATLANRLQPYDCLPVIVAQTHTKMILSCSTF